MGATPESLRAFFMCRDIFRNFQPKVKGSQVPPMGCRTPKISIKSLQHVVSMIYHSEVNSTIINWAFLAFLCDGRFSYNTLII